MKEHELWSNKEVAVFCRCRIPRGFVVKKCNVALQRLSSATLSQHNCVLRPSSVRRRRLSGKQLFQRKGSTGGRESLGSDGMDPGDNLILGIVRQQNIYAPVLAGQCLPHFARQKRNMT